MFIEKFGDIPRPKAEGLKVDKTAQQRQFWILPARCFNQKASTSIFHLLCANQTCSSFSSRDRLPYTDFSPCVKCLTIKRNKNRGHLYIPTSSGHRKFVEIWSHHQSFVKKWNSKLIWGSIFGQHLWSTNSSQRTRWSSHLKKKKKQRERHTSLI